MKTKIITGALLAAALFAVGIKATPKQSSSGQSQQDQTTQGQPKPGMMGGGMMGGMHGRGGPGMGLGMGGAIHGTFVTPKQGGGYQTVDTQRGTVTAVSTTSITVKSSDGFTKTYVVTADTIVNATRDGIASVKNGDEVGVMAVESGSDADAVTIMDRTRIDSSRQKWAPPVPSGSASPSAASSSTA